MTCWSLSPSEFDYAVARDEWIRSNLDYCAREALPMWKHCNDALEELCWSQFPAETEALCQVIFSEGFGKDRLCCRKFWKWANHSDNAQADLDDGLLPTEGLIYLAVTATDAERRTFRNERVTQAADALRDKVAQHFLSDLGERIYREYMQSKRDSRLITRLEMSR